MAVKLPAIALPVKTILPDPAALALTKFCVTPELFVIPKPLMVKTNAGLVVIVKLLAPGLNTIVFTSVLAEREMSVQFEMANVAVLAAPLGTVGGIQFGTLFQSPLLGLGLHVALPPLRVWMPSIKMKFRANSFRTFFIAVT